MTTFNPYVITNVQDSFSVQSQGYWQGDLQDDPAARFQLAPGIVAAGQAAPLWGGVAVFEETAPVTPNSSFLGSSIGRAINATQIAGFSVFNGSYSLPTTPQSPVPMANAGNSFNYVRLGTNNRVVVAVSSAVLALTGAYNPQLLSWDPVNSVVVPYSALSGSPVAITSITWAGGLATVVATAHGLTTGQFATISGAVPAGYNASGPVTVIDANTFTLVMPINPGLETTPGTVQSGLGGFSATLLDVDTNSATVVYNAVTGFATWNTSSNAAVIQI